MNKLAKDDSKKPDHDFNGFNDPLAKVLFGIGIVLTAMICIVVLLISLAGLQFLGFLKLVIWLLGAFSVLGVICGLMSGIRWKTGAAARRASARF